MHIWVWLCIFNKSILYVSCNHGLQRDHISLRHSIIQFTCLAYDLTFCMHLALSHLDDGLKRVILNDDAKKNTHYQIQNKLTLKMDCGNLILLILHACLLGQSQLKHIYNLIKSILMHFWQSWHAMTTLCLWILSKNSHALSIYASIFQTCLPWQLWLQHLIKKYLCFNACP